MYARKYYLIIYRRNLLLEYSRASQQPIVFLCKVTFDLFAIRCIHHIHQIHLVHHSPRSPFTFSLSLFHLFLSFSFPFPLLSPPPFIPLYLTTSGTKTEKKPGQLFRFSQKCINFAAIKKQI